MLAGLFSLLLDRALDQVVEIFDLRAQIGVDVLQLADYQVPRL